jgi:hypothetical protein
VLTKERLDEIGTKLKWTSQETTETPCTGDGHLIIASSLTDKAVTLALQDGCRYALQPSDLANKINFCNWFLQPVHEDKS